jgi:pentatricopeptide repeat domain-containing protein 1
MIACVQGVEPTLRTFNTLMIACNTCNEPDEALRVFETMVAPRFLPNETTFNALISVYGKLGQLNKVSCGPPFIQLPPSLYVSAIN